MSAPDRVAAFLVIADEERTAARSLATSPPRQAAYLCQQAAEKAARALLEHAGVPFGTSHNLGQMAEALPADHTLYERVMALDVLSPAATRFRYPAPTGRLSAPPDADALGRLLDEVDALVAEAQRHCGRG
jgi:HEPN domain-containing protein